MQFKVHPLFYVLAIALVASGRAVAFVWTFIALILHELGHAAMAHTRGFVMKKFVLMPFGAMMSTEENFDSTSGALIGIAGPIVNILLALTTLGLWWLVPSAYPYTEAFLYANLSLGIFNLLPVYPLDGSRVVLGLCKNKLKAIKGLQIAGICVSIICFVLFIASAFYQINFTLGIISLFLFYGAAFATREEMYISVLDSDSKNFSLGVQRRRVAVSCNTPIVRLYHHISASSDTLFEIVNERGAIMYTLNEQQLKGIAICNKLSTPIGNAVRKQDGKN